MIMTIKRMKSASLSDIAIPKTSRERLRNFME